MMKIEDEFRIYREMYAKVSKDFNNLVAHVLPKLLHHNGLFYAGGSWHTTEDGRLFPFVIFEDKSETDYLKRNQTKISGYLCPACLSFDVKLDSENTIAHGRDFTIWLQKWHCEACKAEWEYKRVWAE